MVRRFLSLGVILLLILLSVPACSNDQKTNNQGPTMADPEGGAKPNSPKAG
jgi:hypothetical protein